MNSYLLLNTKFRGFRCFYQTTKFCAQRKAQITSEVT